jgi:hypothetical protein
MHSAVDTFMPRIMNTTSHFRTLSLSAPWNWVTKSARNPRPPLLPSSLRFDAAGRSGAAGTASGDGNPEFGVWVSVTVSKLTTHAANGELKNLYPASPDAMAEHREGTAVFS